MSPALATVPLEVRLWHYREDPAHRRIVGRRSEVGPDLVELAREIQDGLGGSVEVWPHPQTILDPHGPLLLRVSGARGRVNRRPPPWANDDHGRTWIRAWLALDPRRGDVLRLLRRRHSDRAAISEHLVKVRGKDGRRGLRGLLSGLVKARLVTLTPEQAYRLTREARDVLADS